jgi:hypothetical protein
LFIGFNQEDLWTGRMFVLAEFAFWLGVNTGLTGEQVFV